MESRIWRKKIMLIFHIYNLDDEDLEKKMMMEQDANKWPGLVEEVKAQCESLNLEDPMKTTLSKKEYGKAVEKACKWKDEAMMKADMERMKDRKMKTMYHQNLEMKDYVKTGTLYSARSTWQVRSYMMDVAGNYRNYVKYKHTSWKCQACNLDVIEDQDHLIVCDGYADLHQGADLRMEPELVDFYQRVLDRRKEKNWN